MNTADTLHPTCFGCGRVLDGSDFNSEKTTMIYEQEEIEVCVACFEELGGYEQIC